MSKAIDYKLEYEKLPKEKQFPRRIKLHKVRAGSGWLWNKFISFCDRRIKGTKRSRLNKIERQLDETMIAEESFLNKKVDALAEYLGIEFMSQQTDNDGVWSEFRVVARKRKAKR